MSAFPQTFQTTAQLPTQYPSAPRVSRGRNVGMTPGGYASTPSAPMGGVTSTPAPNYNPTIMHPGDWHKIAVDDLREKNGMPPIYRAPTPARPFTPAPVAAPGPSDAGNIPDKEWDTAYGRGVDMFSKPNNYGEALPPDQIKTKATDFANLHTRRNRYGQPAPATQPAPGGSLPMAPTPAPGAPVAQPAPSAATQKNEPASRKVGTIGFDPELQKFAYQQIRKANPNMSEDEAKQEFTRSFTKYTQGSQLRDENNNPITEKGLPELADRAAPYYSPEKTEKPTILHRMPVADGSNYPAFVQSNGETFVHTGGGGYESNRGRVLRMGPDGKQIGEVAQGPRPKNLGIRWDQNHQAQYDQIKQLAQKQATLQRPNEQLGSSGLRPTNDADRAAGEAQMTPQPARFTGEPTQISSFTHTAVNDKGERIGWNGSTWVPMQ